MGGEIGLHSAVGEVLRNHQNYLGLTQKEFAGMLGISQPYLSRIYSGQRSAVSLQLWNKILEVVPRPELLILDSSIDDATDAFERALVAAGAGNHMLAELLFEQVADALTAIDGSSIELATRARFHLAGIRRDKFQLTGPSGANALYLKTLTAYRERSRRNRVEEVQFMIGACREMSEDSAGALKLYGQLRDSAEPGNLRLAIRVNGRIGALTTKMGDFEMAAKHLKVATTGSVDLDDSGPYSYYHEKLAILRTKEGQLDQAFTALKTARTEIAPGDILRRVQSECVESSILHASGDTDGSLRLLKHALRSAQRYEFAHQERYITKAIQETASRADRPPRRTANKGKR